MHWLRCLHWSHWLCQLCRLCWSHRVCSRWIARWTACLVDIPRIVVHTAIANKSATTIVEPTTTAITSSIETLVPATSALSSAIETTITSSTANSIARFIRSIARSITRSSARLPTHSTASVITHLVVGATNIDKRLVEPGNQQRDGRH